MNKNTTKITFKEAIFVSIIVLAILGGIMIFIPNATPHIAIISAMIFLIIYGLVKKVSFNIMQEGMIKSVNTGMGAIYLFFFIGILISSLMMSGAIPTLMYLGLNTISSNTFYLSTFIITSIIGVAIGSSLTTVSTIGVALMGIAVAFEANIAITAGAIVSGAFFGDKMSPLSDTTNIAASIVGVELFDHIKNMAKTTIPVFIISSIIYLILSLNISIPDIANIESFKNDILSTGLVHWYSLLPFLILLILAILKVNSVVSMIITTIISTLLSFISNSYSLTDLSTYFYSGFSMSNLPDSVVSLISRGGLSSMFFTTTVVILALSLGGLLFSLGIISTILDKTKNFLTTPFKATLCVALTAVGINYIVGEQYLSILLTGETFKSVYENLNLHPKNLSRTLEDAGTVINPLVPWSVCGTFIASTLNISVLSYVPFAFFCIGSVIFTILSGLNKKSLTKN